MTCVSCMLCVPCLLSICGYKSQHVQERLRLRFVCMPVASCFAAQAPDPLKVLPDFGGKNSSRMSLVYHFRPLEMSLGNQTTEALFRCISEAAPLWYARGLRMHVNPPFDLRWLFAGRVACYCMLNEQSQCINITKSDLLYF